MAEPWPKTDFGALQVSKHHRMPVVEMLVVNLHPVRKRLLMDKTLNIAFVRLERDPGDSRGKYWGGGQSKKVDNHF